MNIAKDFVDFMVAQGLGAFGESIFIGNMPASTPNTCWSVIPSGGRPLIPNSTGERVKAYTLEVRYRSNNAEDVYDTLQAFEELVNSNSCTQLANFDTIDLEALVFPTDEDLDSEDRTIGLVQVTLTTYK